MNHFFQFLQIVDVSFEVITNINNVQICDVIIIIVSLKLHKTAWENHKK